MYPSRFREMLAAPPAGRRNVQISTEIASIG
jgi:hypothetical protein